MKFEFSIDRGGTFTDIYAKCVDSGKVIVTKLLSVDSSYSDAPREGIRRIISQESGVELSRDELIDGSWIEWIRMGTTVATNALLERNGERMALVITKGFKDLLHIGNQTRPQIFDLSIEMSDCLYEEVVEIDERVIVERSDSSSQCWRKEISSTGEIVFIAKELDLESARKDLVKILDKGIKTLSILLLHSYMYADHEIKLGKLAQELGFSHISLSSQVLPMIRAVPRGFTTSADAYLTPLIKKYIKGFVAGFTNLDESQVLFMKSDGGLTPMGDFCGSRAVLSGPAGGVVGYSVSCYGLYKRATIGFDMGGTSTDVSRFGGVFEMSYESVVGGVQIQAPQLDISTVAAGGGSLLTFRNGLFRVGPASAGAAPGPISYKKGGKELTVTDANLYLGRLIPQFFPKIFGPNDNESLDRNSTVLAFEKLKKEVNTYLKSQGSKEMETHEIAMGFLRVANESMCRPIRSITEGKGYDSSTHILACFGGAGGQHACEIARSLGISTVIIPKYGGILSAFGLALADIVYENQEPIGKDLIQENIKYIDERFDALEEKCRSQVLSNLKNQETEAEYYLNLRYQGTDCALMTLPIANTESKVDTMSKYGDFVESFIKRHEAEFGFTINDRSIVVDDIRVRLIVKSGTASTFKVQNNSTENPMPKCIERVYFESSGWTNCPIYLTTDLSYYQTLNGPCLLIDELSTVVIDPNSVAKLAKNGDILIAVGGMSSSKIGTSLDSVQLSIFSHRFMSIAEQMGKTLQRTAISTNIKERLDFSCAIFGNDGGLVSNAPHIPVHLGAMQEAVQFQLRNLKGDLEKGDVILSNHPAAGGSHLPDLTVITPVFHNVSKEPIFFVACRGHHADIGGITPGSMPPHSKWLWEEGAVFTSFKLVSKGIFNEKELIEQLNAPGKYPGSSPTRNLKDNLADLRAQVAANQKGINLIHELISIYGLDVVQAYMKHIQKNAESGVRTMLKTFSKNLGKSILNSEDYMDDGTKIQLEIRLNEDEGSGCFDFSGTGTQVWGNCNAPRAITLSAIIYCLRTLVGEDIPLNQGCLAPIEIIIPRDSILSPSPDAAVVGGNVQTSQRVVDVILKAFQASAASQGCMNNLTFGDETIGYYETIAGGAGAGPSWNGRSGVHTHMTNTRITDPEILETRYPVILQHFSLEPGTGGSGKFRGGDGVRRELVFRKALTVSVLTERRVFRPYGMNGGSDGKSGSNLLIKKGNKIINLGGKTTVNVLPHEVLCILTPGGGGYGTPV